MNTKTDELTCQSTNTKKFNTNLDRLLQTLSNFYPEDSDLATYHEKFKTVIHVNAKLVSQYFLVYTEDKIGPIIQRDDSYFLEKINYKEITQNQKALEIIQKILTLWTTTVNEKLKKTIGDYIELLLIFAIKANRRQDLVPVVNSHRKKPITL
jgi:hypothetical protein